MIGYLAKQKTIEPEKLKLTDTEITLLVKLLQKELENTPNGAGAVNVIRRQCLTLIQKKLENL
jgi:hypothetical protein